MRVIDFEKHAPLIRQVKGGELAQAFRKFAAFRIRLTPRKLANLTRCLLAYLLQQPGWLRYPVHMKIDVSPNCQMRCPVCPHSVIATLPDRHMPPLMKTGLFYRIVDQVRDHTLVLSLYNLGEPLLNPEIAEMARYASENGLGTYLTSNLSLPMSDRLVSDLAASGLNLLIVAVDGISPETFGRQRIRGDLDLITRNLRRLVAARDPMPGSALKISLQYIVFDFNRHEKADAIAFARALALDEIHFIHGQTEPWTEREGPRTSTMPRGRHLTPHCAWPYFSMVVNSTGGVTACCKFRMDEIYRNPAAFRAMGNAQRQEIAEIFAAPAYQSARSLSNNPRKAGRRAEHFCDGCGVLYADTQLAPTLSRPGPMQASPTR